MLLGPRLTGSVLLVCAGLLGCGGAASNAAAPAPEASAGEGATPTEEPTAPEEPTPPRDAALEIGVGPVESQAGPGSLDPEIVHRMVTARAPALAACFGEHVVEPPEAASRIIVELTIAAEGTVSAVHLREDGVGVPALTSCVEAVATHLRFVPGPEGGSCTVTFPIVFTPGSPEAFATDGGDRAALIALIPRLSLDDPPEEQDAELAALRALELPDPRDAAVRDACVETYEAVRVAEAATAEATARMTAIEEEGREPSEDEAAAIRALLTRSNDHVARADAANDACSAGRRQLGERAR